MYVCALSAVIRTIVWFILIYILSYDCGFNYLKFDLSTALLKSVAFQKSIQIYYILHYYFILYVPQHIYCLKIMTIGFQTFFAEISFTYVRESYLFRFWRKRAMVETANIILAETGNFQI